MYRGLQIVLRCAILFALCGMASLTSVRHQARADSNNPGRRLVADGPKSKYGKEVTALRTRSSRTYAGPHGSFVDVISGGAVNYKDAQGNWQPIDDTLVPSTGAANSHTNKADAYQLTLPDQLAAAPVKVDFAGGSVTQQLEGASGSGVVSGNEETYANALPSTSVTYAATPSGLKESLRIGDASGPSSYVFDVTVSSGLSLQLDKQGGVQLLDGNHKKVATLRPPSLVDKSGATSRDVDVSLDQTADRYKLTLTPSHDWLSDPARQFPVTLDPSTSFGFDSLDCYINSSTPTTSYCGSGTNLDVGTDANGESRSLLYWNLTQLGLPANAVMLDVDLQMYLQAEDNATSISVSGYRMLTNWIAPNTDPQDTTWNDAYGTNAWSTPGGDFKTPPATSRPTDLNNGTGVYYDFRFTQLAQHWGVGDMSNFGLMLKEDSGSGQNMLHFTSGADYANPPQLLVTYEYPLGQRGLYTYVNQSLDDRLGLGVNVAWGNLLLSANDLHIAGTGPDEDVSRYYNSLSSGMDTNGGCEFACLWQLGGAQDVYLQFYADGSAAYWGPSGYAVPFIKTASGDYVSPTAQDETLISNSDGTYTLSSHADSSVQNFDAQGRLVSIVDPNGNTIGFTYGPSANPTGDGYQVNSITDTQGRVTSFTYDTNGYLTKITDPAGRTYQYAEDGNGELTSYTDPNGKVTKFGWTYGLLMQVTDPNLNAVKFNYDLNNRVTSITRGTAVWSFTYNDAASGASSPNTVVKDPDGHTTTYYYDGYGRVIKIVDGLGNTTFTTGSNGFNDDSKLLGFTNGDNGTSSFGYDGTNENRIQATIPTGASTHDQYADSAYPYYPTSFTDAQNHTWNYSYDGHGNLLSQQEQGQAPVSFTYNANGTVATATNGNGHTTSYGYDPKGNLTSISPPAPLGKTTISYDSLSRIQTVTDGKGQTTSYVYDGLDRVTKITYNDNSTVAYGYDANGNLTSQADQNGTDSFTFDNQNRLTKETIPGGKTNTYGWDPTGNLISFADAGGTVTYHYNNANELTSLTDPNSKQTTFAYDNDHNRTQTNYPNSISQTVTYDPSDRITSIIGKNTVSGAIITSLTYSYGSGSDTMLRQSVTDNVSGQTTTYGYDYANRLASAVSPAHSYQYSYDPDGNRTSETVDGVTTNASYDNADELTQYGSTSFSSDANGDLLKTATGLALTYNPKEQTATVGSDSMSYLDAGQTRRIGAGSTSFQNSSLGVDAETSSGTSTYYTRDPDSTLISERTAPTTT